jgi:branched-chain amino acid transport system substrate-binding protein
LILRSGVHALMGAFQTAVTFTSTQVAEKYQTPYIVIVSVGDGITERGFRYTFRINNRASDDSKVQARITREQTKKQGIEKPRVALLYENSEWGQDCAKTQKEYLAKEGLGDSIVLDEKYNPGSPDLTRSAEKVKAAKPDVVLLSCYLADGILLTKAFAQLRIDAMVFCKGAEHSQPAFLPAVGNLADYQLWVIPWHKDLVEKKPDLRAVYNKYVAETKNDLTSYAAMAYANVYLLKDALERAASTDRNKIRDALASTKISSGRALMLPAEGIEFGPDGQCKHVVVNVMQTQNGVEKYVSPAELAPKGNKMVWPAPPWSERKAK